MEVQVLDPEVRDLIVGANTELIEMGRTPNQGVKLELKD